MLKSLDGPLILVRDQVLYPAHLDPNNLDILSLNALVINSREHPLYQGATLDDLVSFIFINNEEKIKKEDKKELEEQLNLNETKIIGNLSSIQYNKLLMLNSIIFNIMPHFLSEYNYSKLENKLEGNKVAYMDFLIEKLGGIQNYIEHIRDINKTILNDLYNKIMALEIPAINILQHFDEVLSTISKDFKIKKLVNKNYSDYMFLIKGSLYPLKHKNDGAIKLNGKTYTYEAHLDLDLFKFLYNIAKSRVVIEKRQNIKDNIKAISDKLNDINQIKEHALLIYFANKKKFEKDNFGFIERNLEGAYSVYINIPEYILANEDEELYLFPGCSIASNIEVRNEGIHSSRPYVLNNYKHPFVSGDSLRGICLGNYTYTSKNYSDGCIESLLMGKKVLISGYMKDSFRGYRRLNMENFPKFRINQNHPKLVKGEVKITNR